MAEEGTSPGTETGAPGTEAGQGGEQATGQVESGKGQGTQPAPGTEAGQGGKAPEGDKTSKAGAQKGDDTPAWDGDTLKWMESKGYESSAYDPANDSHQKLIKSAREQEAAFTRFQQEKKTNESFEKAKKADDTTGSGEEEKGPLALFEDMYKNEVLKALEYNECETAEDLYNKNPKVYAKLERMYTLKRQEAWEKEQDWKQKQATKKAEQEKIHNQYRDDFKKAAELSEKTISKLQVKYPNLRSNFTKHGVDKFLQTLADKYSVFKEMVFLDDSMANFLAEASEAIAYRYAEPDRKKEWEQQYEKDKLKLATASGPRPAGIGGLSGGKTAGGTGSGLDNLSKHSRDLIKAK